MQRAEDERSVARTVEDEGEDEYGPNLIKKIEVNICLF